MKKKPIKQKQQKKLVSSNVQIIAIISPNSKFNQNSINNSVEIRKKLKKKNIENNFISALKQLLPTAIWVPFYESIVVVSLTLQLLNLIGFSIWFYLFPPIAMVVCDLRSVEIVPKIVYTFYFFYARISIYKVYCIAKRDYNVLELESVSLFRLLCIQR